MTERLRWRVQSCTHWIQPESLAIFGRARLQPSFFQSGGSAGDTNHQGRCNVPMSLRGWLRRSVALPNHPG